MSPVVMNRKNYQAIPGGDTFGQFLKHRLGPFRLVFPQACCKAAHGWLPIVAEFFKVQDI